MTAARPTVGFALGGLAGNNAHGAGFLHGALSRGLEPAMICMHLWPDLLGLRVPAGSRGRPGAAAQHLPPGDRGAAPLPQHQHRLRPGGPHGPPGGLPPGLRRVPLRPGRQRGAGDDEAIRRPAAQLLGQRADGRPSGAAAGARVHRRVLPAAQRRIQRRADDRHRLQQLLPGRGRGVRLPQRRRPQAARPRGREVRPRLCQLLALAHLIPCDHARGGQGRAVGSTSTASRNRRPARWTGPTTGRLCSRS